MAIIVSKSTSNKFDITIVLNAHREGNLLLRTLFSLRDAATFAVQKGLRLELVCVFDCSDPPTDTAFSKVALSSFENVVCIRTDYASLARARVAGCSIAQGKYINLCDGDDLISFNALFVMYREAERWGPSTVLFHNWLFAFGDRSHTGKYIDYERIGPFSFLDVNPYTSKAFFDKRVLSEVSFRHVAIRDDYAYEDWHFNCELVARGFTFRVAPETIVFYRQREGLLAVSNRESVRTIPPTALFRPDVFIDLCEKWSAQAGDPALFVEDDQEHPFLKSHVCRLLVHAANKLEPEIEYNSLVASESYIPTKAINVAVGRTYLEVCRQIKSATFAHVFLLPWVARGGADRYFINLINTLCETRPNEKVVAFLGEKGLENTWVCQLAASCTVIDLSKDLESIGSEGICTIVLKVIQACAPQAVLHLRTSLFAFRFFRQYGRVLRDNRHVLYQFGNDCYIDGEFFATASWSPAFITEQETRIDLFVTDSLACARETQIRTLSDEKWRILPTLCNPTVPRDAVAGPHGAPRKVLWASRLVHQKRAGLLTAIARRLAILSPGLSIDVWGEPDPDFHEAASRSSQTNLRYKGAYDSFDDIAAGGYSCFVYTSLFDGVPTVLLEAAANGLPIIAPDVGGVGLFIIDGETGVLLPSLACDDEMADAYAEAIVALTRDDARRRHLALNAYDLLNAGHSTEAYVRSVSQLMETLNENRASQFRPRRYAVPCHALGGSS